jgi:pilus assembly protein CpaC
MVLSPNRINYLLKPSVIWAACLSVIATGALWAQAPTGNEIPLVVGKSIVLDVPDEIQRVSITDDTIADVVAISTREILINAKGEGITTLVLWSRAGDRNFFTINVGSNLQQIQDLVRAAFPGEPVRLISSQGLVTLNGSVSSPEVEERILAMLGGMGAQSVVSNLELPIPAADRQIVLRVRFVEVQRNALSEFGANLLSTGALNTPGGISTQQFGGARVQQLSGTIGGALSGTSTNFSLTDTLNIFAFRPDLNLGILLRALESRGISQLLAEPNVVTTSGKEADLLIGGEFPVPIVQGGAGAGAVTIQFREFGIRINFLPVFTPRGSIQMHVRPEVSALDFANAVTLQGFLIPALSTRRVETDVELMPGQSFVIGGLIDSRMAETINRVPILSSIPLLGEIFKSRSRDRNNSELLVLVTPEFPEVYESGEPTPTVVMPEEFMPPLTESLDWKK